MDELIEHVPEVLRERFQAVVGLMDGFCDRHLNDEYKQLCRQMAAVVFQAGSPARTGKPASWAAGIVHALGWVNFLHDPSQRPHMKSPRLAEGFGISQGTMTTKSKAIRDGMDLVPFDPDWTLPSKLADNPLAWLVQLSDGMIIDVRAAPQEAQGEALRLGLIPFIPQDAAHDSGEEEWLQDEKDEQVVEDDDSARSLRQRNLEAHEKRVEAILGGCEELDFDEAVGAFYEHLKANLKLPCEVTGTEDFRWEEFYVVGPGSRKEHERLRKTRPSYQDRYELLGIDRGILSEWMLFGAQDIAAHVGRGADGKEFYLGLAELQATDQESPNYQIIDDYGVWFANAR